ncbi:MAG: di-trans,poly-cis-decaprenylcistransferase [Planctomycetota bacterium]|nr:MAG: di-trans,poly-cis-decaprenylcistransferase [Planctomycetota bacterium]GDY07938.1 isoprenyl transferase [Planctomycetia bacterium]
MNPVPFDVIKAARRLSDLGLAAEKLPSHIAIIMDGNGRWAKARGFPRIEGHRRGVRSVRETIEECAELGIEQLTLYCLSSENWKRPQRELDMLMRLLEQYLVEERSEIMRQDLRFAMIGRREGLSAGVLREVAKTVEVSRNNHGTRLCLAVNYGGRQELVDAFRRIATRLQDGSLTVDAIDEVKIAEHLDTAGMPDPDLVIRTAGEMRMSNYLLWQASYAEFWVTSKCWPEFRPTDLHDALRDYANRERRFGGLSR